MRKMTENNPFAQRNPVEVVDKLVDEKLALITGTIRKPETMTKLKVATHFCNNVVTIHGEKNVFDEIGDIYALLHASTAIHSKGHKGKTGDQITDIGKELMAWIGSQKNEKKTIL